MNNRDEPKGISIPSDQIPPSMHERLNFIQGTRIRNNGKNTSRQSVILDCLNRGSRMYEDEIKQMEGQDA